MIRTGADPEGAVFKFQLENYLQQMMMAGLKNMSTGLLSHAAGISIPTPSALSEMARAGEYRRIRELVNVRNQSEQEGT